MSRAVDLVAGMVLESGARWGQCATPEQWSDVISVLDPNSPPYQYWTRARGYSKSTDASAIAIAMLLETLPVGSFLYALASDRDQGRLIVDAVRGICTRTPELAGALTVDSFKVTARNGSVLEVLAADAPSAWGLRPSFVCVDELAQWPSTAGPRALWEAVTSAMAKLPRSRLLVMTSSGMPEHWSHKVLEHAKADPLWRVHEIPGPAPWTPPERLDEQKRRLTASSYTRLFENQWCASEDRLTSLNDLRACVTLEGPQSPREGVVYVIGVDLGVRHDRTVAAVCHGEREGTATTVALDRMEVWAGSPARPVDFGVVEEWLRETSRCYNHATIEGDPWQAIGMYQRLRAAGVRVNEFTFSQSSIGKLATTVYTAIRDHHIALPPDEALLDELANVRLRETSTPGVLRLDTDPDKHDDRVVALSLCAQRILEFVPRRPARLKCYGPSRPPSGRVFGPPDKSLAEMLGLRWR